MTGESVADAMASRDGEDLKRYLAQVWAEVLGVSTVGYDADFTTLGGNSLHAARITARVRSLFATELTLRELFEAGTVRALVERIVDRRGSVVTQPAPEAPAVTPARATGSEPAPSLQQQRLWFLDHLNPTAGVAYNVPMVTHVRGPLDLAALHRAMADVVGRHAQLRTRFFLDGDRLRAETVDVEVPFREVDLSDREDPAAEAYRQVETLTARHVELDVAPLLRCTVFRLSADEYVVALLLHHLVADGWTVDIVDRDLASAYRARLDGRPGLLPEPALAYEDYARWQRRLVGSAHLAALREYWRRELAGVDPVLDLPTDLRRPSVRGYHGRRISSRTSPRLGTAIRELAARTGTTPYAVFLTAFGVYLRKLTGRRDLLVATPTAGRPDSQTEDVVGFFTNTLIVRIRPGAGTFRDLVVQTHASVLDGLDHQYVPLEQLVREFAPPGDLSRPPLAQVALAYQGPRRAWAELAGTVAEPVAVDNGTAKFDLTVEVYEVAEGFDLTAEYDTALFRPGRARTMLDELLVLLDTAVTEPDTSLATLVNGRQGEASVRPAGDGRCLHEVFATVAACWPDSIAVEDGTRRLTYRELDLAANRLAHRLRRAGVGPERVVGLCAERSVALIVGVLAVLKAGGGYLPLDPRHPSARHQLTLDDAGCGILLGDAELCTALTGGGRSFVDIRDSCDHEPEEPPHVDVRPEHLAYVIYTSGSTGRPKGVVVTHSNVTRLFRATDDDFGFGPDDVWTMFHSIAFDFSVWELWGALLHGARLVLVPYQVSRDPAEMLDLIRAEGVTVLNQTPTAFRQLAGAAEDSGHPDLALRYVVFGGEALDPAILRSWAEGYGLGRPRLVNMYGITETTVHVTIRPIEESDLHGSVSPVGRPINDLRVHLLDEHLRQVPVGVEGELYIGGPGVARGYLNRAALTAERFVSDPFGPTGSRLYRSGDLAVLGPDGDLEYRGRADSQVKLHGFRIELGEIERALLDQPGVRAAACVLREDIPGLPRIVGYLVPAPQRILDPAGIRSALGRVLPAHMVPAVLMEMPALPATGNGKLDRVNLPVPAADAGTADAGTADAGRADAGPTGPVTPEERTLARIWSEALGVPSPGIDDDFFVLGGDSIVAVRVGALARAAGLPVTVEQIFLNPTIAELAAACRQTRVAALPPPVERLSATTQDIDQVSLPADVMDAYPLAAMQAGIIFECELAESPGLYHDGLSVRVDGPFDPAALDDVLAAVAARHDVLRTSIDLGRYAEPLQLVHRARRIPMSVESAAGLLDDPDQAPAETVLRDWWRRELASPFELTEAPLVRCHVLRLSERCFQLAFAVHHSVVDGWSFARLMTEVLLEYDRLVGGGKVGAGPADGPASRYRDFVAAEQVAAADPDAENFWRAFLAAHPPAPLPHPVTDVPGSPGAAAFRADLSADLAAGLHRVAAACRVPVKSVFLAAHLWAVGRLTGRSDVVSGLQVNGRLEHPGADQVLGLFLNITPVGLEIDGSWEELVRAAFTTERFSQPYRRYPLAGIRRMAGGSPFEVVFNYTDFHVFRELDGLKHVGTRDWWSADRHSFPLMVEVVRDPGTAEPAIVVSAGLESAHASTATALGALVVQALEDIAADPTGLCRPTS